MNTEEEASVRKHPAQFKFSWDSTQSFAKEYQEAGGLEL